MLNRLRLVVVTLAAALALVVGVAPPASATTYTWHHSYYDNYFGGWWKCYSRGKGATGHRSHDQIIRGAVDFICFKHPRQAKWSMDILFEDTGGVHGWVPER